MSPPPPHLGDALRQVMRGVAATVTVVSTEQDGVWYGMTATSFTSLSLDPPSVLIAVNRDASLHDPLLRRGAFAVNVLREGPAEAALSQLFGSSAVPSDERFRHGRWRAHRGGLPILEDAQAWLVCRIVERLEVGTHTLVVGRVVDVSPLAADIAPLVYVDGTYRRLAG